MIGPTAARENDAKSLPATRADGVTLQAPNATGGNMRKYGLARGARTTVAACMALAFLTACSSESAAPSSSGTFFGPSQPIGNGTVKTYVTVDEAGAPTEVGLRLTRSALDGLPQDTGPGQTMML